MNSGVARTVGPADARNEFDCAPAWDCGKLRVGPDIDANKRSNERRLMRTQSSMAVITAVVLTLSASTKAADVAGKWKSEFESQIGVQKYTYEFKVDGDKLTGKAIGIRNDQTNDVAITEGKISGDEISFIEPLKFQDQDVRIEYKGKVSGDELKLHRKVGEFADYDIVAKRVKESTAAPEPKPAPAKP